MKLFLLDAYALIYRAYYGFIKNPRINSRGENVSAVFGFLNSLEEVLAKEQPTHIGVAFDPHGGTFRHEAYPPYKAQREETPEAIRFGTPIIKEILGAYNIPVIEVAGFEADDVIGTLARQADEQGITTYMMTPDKDYGQLVTPRVSIFKPRNSGPGFETLGPAEVCAKWGIKEPKQVIDILGLMGDASDNIPGCPKVGEKTAAQLIQQFGSVENLLTATGELKGKLRERVEENVEQIRMSKWLATIVTDVPVALDMEALRYTEPDHERLTELLLRYELRALLQRKFGDTPSQSARGRGYMSSGIQAETPASTRGAREEAGTQLDLFSQPAEEPLPASAAPQAEETPTSLAVYSPETASYCLVDTPEEQEALARKLAEAEVVSIDTETTSTNAIDAELVGLSFAVREAEGYYVPVPADRAEAQATAERFRCVYENPASLKVGQNLKYDINVLANYGIEVSGPLFDTMVAHYVLQPEMHHGMDYLAEAYLHYRTIHIDELIGKKERGKQQLSMRDVAPGRVCPYAAEDADITLRLYKTFLPMLHDEGAYELFAETEMPLVPVLAEMERTGVRIDTDALKAVGVGFDEQLRQIEREVWELAGEEFNIQSPRQVGVILFERMHLDPRAKKTKSGQYTTSEEALERIRHKSPIVEKILEYRRMRKLSGTYIDALPKLINPRTGHIHTSFNQTITATGRLSSSEPNLQNIPVRSDAGREIRKAFRPEPGQLFFSADYSQVELRIMAHLSQDESLIDDFRQGHDIHTATAAKIFHKAPEDVTRDERSRAKTANFGIIYGITAFGLTERLGISRTEAKQLIDTYFIMYPRVHAYMQESIERAREQGFTTTLLGRRCYLRDINSHNATVRGLAERIAINAPIQGSAADIIKRAMVAISRRFSQEGIRSKMILQVHDELNFSVLPEERERVEQIVISEMQGAASLSVPLIADSGWGDNWLEAH
ncbi:MAG: DNA polymerase I [Bacteroidaceae bacterium]|nr:DNA polymerase I [Bacteroidaceae bacterium]